MFIVVLIGSLVGMSLAEAQELTVALGGKWHGHYGTAPCPVCQSERRKDQTALTLGDGHSGLLLNCKKSACSFSDVLRAMGVAGKRREGDRPFAKVDQASEGAKTSGYAEKLWQESLPTQATAAEVYLGHSRKIGCKLPASLRFNRFTWHGPSRQNLPALIARIEGGTGFAVSRTYLRSDGSGKADLPKDLQKMMLGGAKGGHVALQTGSGSLVVAEGIETALSLPCLFDLGPATIWAALTAVNLRTVQLPAASGHLLIATDGDEAGQRSGEALAARAARLGWTVEFLTAPAGKDWNDVLLEQVALRDGVAFFETTGTGG
jgi:hypothetical protein